MTKLYYTVTLQAEDGTRVQGTTEALEYPDTPKEYFADEVAQNVASLADAHKRMVAMVKASMQAGKKPNGVVKTMAAGAR